MKTKLYRMAYMICCAAMITAAIRAGKNHDKACSECNLAIDKKDNVSWAKLPTMYLRYRKS